MKIFSLLFFVATPRIKVAKTNKKRNPVGNEHFNENGKLLFNMFNLFRIRL